MGREKVIKGLEEAETMLTQAVNRGGEMAVMGAFKCLNHVSDALVLLKEQEAVEPKKADNPEESEYCCGSCEYPLWLDELYCAHCGRPVLWEGR